MTAGKTPERCGAGSDRRICADAAALSSKPRRAKRSRLQILPCTSRLSRARPYMEREVTAECSPSAAAAAPRASLPGVLQSDLDLVLPRYAGDGHGRDAECGESQRQKAAASMKARARCKWGGPGRSPCWQPKRVRPWPRSSSPSRRKGACE
jgi:hypothetical protein